MFQKKSTQTKSFKGNKILDSILWSIENYLPQKKKRSSHSELILNNFESFTLNIIKKLEVGFSKFLRGNLSNTTITFTIGNWALPYLNFLKRIKLIK